MNPPGRTRRMATAAVAAALAALAVAGCGSAGGGDGAGQSKAGGDAPPVTLRIGTADNGSQPAALVLNEFARLVAAAGDPSIEVEPVFTAVPQNTDDWDQQVARQVIAGELDMALVPARAWDTEGVITFRALHAPFLVDSDNLVDAVAGSDLATEMLAGLEPVGVTGLALLPEGLRHVFSFTSPLVGPDDYRGALVRSPNSATTYALFEALGADPDDFPGQQIGDAFEAGTLTAVESSFELASFEGDAITTAGNVVPFPKVNTLVINTERLEALSGEQREAIESAARGTLQFARGGVVPDAERAAEWCQRQAGSILIASDAEVAGLLAAAEPVYRELEKDDQTRQMIADIRELKARVTPGLEVAGCEAEPVAPVAGATGAPSAIDGVYRYEVTKEMFLERGLTSLMDEAGVHTLTIDSGRWLDEWSGQTCEGAATVDGDLWTIKWVGNCFGDWSMRLADTDPVTWTEITTLPPWHTDPETIAANEVFNSVPLTRIGDAP